MCPKHLARRARAVAVTLAAVSAGSPVAAQVVLDGTTGPAGALAGPDYAIGAELGRRAGSNLFHSFERFGIQTGESATFSGPEGIANVIGRVTGGERSDIDGVLRSTIPGAALWFLNPAGVVFGPNAQLDVQGSFHASTADELRFQDGATFSAVDPGVSRFTVAPPEAFGFLGGRPGQLTVDGSTLEVSVADKEALSLVAGDVRLRGGTVVAGSVLVAAQEAEGGVPVRPEGPPVARDGRVTLTPDGSVRASILTSGPRGGTVRIEGGEVTVDRSNLFDRNPGDLDSDGGIVVGARSLTVIGEAANGGLSTVGAGRGRAGTITVVAPEVRVAGGTISSGLSGSAAAGDVTIDADRVGLERVGASLGTISAPANFEAGPDATGGTITVTARETLTVRGGSQIFSSTFGRGDAGSVVIEAGRLEVLTDPASPLGFESTVSAATFGGGAGGSLDIEAGEVLVDNGFISAGAGSTSTGRGGDIDLTADHVVLRNTGFIETSAFGAGPGGSITIRASDGIEITSGANIAGLAANAGRGATIAITTPRLHLDDGRINASTVGSRRAGSITVRADEVEILNKGEINSSSAGEGLGGPGSIRLDVGRLVLESGAIGSIASPFSSPEGSGGGDIAVTARSEILISGQPGASSAITSETSGARNAGSVRIEAPVLRMPQHGLIDSSTNGTGDAGAVTVEVDRLTMGPGAFISSTSPNDPFPDLPGGRGRVRVVANAAIEIAGDPDQDLPSGITTLTATAGPAGSVEVETPFLEIGAGGRISSTTSASGRGGTVEISVDRVEVAGEDAITTRSRGVGADAGQAGGIVVEATDTLRISGGSVSARTERADAGDVEVRVGRLVDLQDGAITTSVANGTGGGGNIVIRNPRFVVLDDSRIVAQAEAGRGGDIRIAADNLIRTPDSQIDASSRRGPPGTVAIGAPEQDVGGGLVALPAGFLDAATQLPESCAARRSEDLSSFTAAGRGGLPPGPAAPLPGFYALGQATPAMGAASPSSAPAAPSSPLRLAGLEIACRGGR